MSNILSNNLKSVIKTAISIQHKKKTAKVMPSHLFLALEKQTGCLAHNILSQIKYNPQKISTQPKLKLKIQEPDTVKFDNKTIQLLKKSAHLALQNDHVYVGTEHLLAAILELPASEIKQITNTTLPIKKIKKHILTVLDSSSHVNDFSSFSSNKQKTPVASDNALKLKTLNSFSTDLTNIELQKEINPVIGRDIELDRIIQILSRKDKNNPIIIGEAGVGKTAIVEGLAKRITENKVPPILLNKKILNIDLGSIVAGTTYRGDFENRLKSILDAVESNPNIIIFIDEIHNIIGAGNASGTMDTANMLKPLLARGKLRCIGATTADEYKKYIEADSALDRRFQPIHLKEPTVLESIEILKGVKQNYQDFHKVMFTDNAIDSAVKLSQQYIQDKLLPDKAIDIIDEAASKQKLNHTARNKVIEKLNQLQKKLEDIQLTKEEAVLAEDYNQAIEIKKLEQKLSKELCEINEQINKKRDNYDTIITKADILDVISQKTNIPIHDLNESEYKKLARITEKIKETVFGQTSNIDSVMETILHSKLGLNDKNKPLASFLFAGSSGVGKTYLAQRLAKEIFTNKENFIQLDMSEYNDAFQSTKLIGAPAGYVGYRESNKFTDLVKKNPYCLVLFDEIEKAHPNIQNLLLQILEYGHITDSVGKKINFKNAIIIMTTNVFHKKDAIGFENANSQDKTAIKNELKKHFKPELINRLDNVIEFNDLQSEHLKQILQKEIKILQNKLQENQIELNVADDLTTYLANLAIKEKAGARSINTLIKNHLKQPLIKNIIEKKQTINSAKLNRNKIIFK
jgi:ATP-dependent Clp protease ATP-binding subunit ClpC